MKTLLCLAAVLGLSIYPCFSQHKINGVSLVGGPNKVTQSSLDPIVAIDANWITLMPFAYGKFGSPHLSFKDLEWQWWGEGPAGIKEASQIAHQRGLEVMIKPHLWFDHGNFTGHFELQSEDDWRIFEAEYTEFIMQFVNIAAETDVSMFCIGTELCVFSQQRPQFWKNLIEKIRKVYSGNLTYASNWDSFEKISFWSNLDYVGIDAYFPLNDSKTPTKNEIMQGWEPHENAMKQVYSTCGRPVIFTEWGYRSTDYSCREPWESGGTGNVNLQAQANAFAATFELFWSQDWFAGGFVWKWFTNHKESGGHDNDRFTPQNKPAEEILKTWFKKYS